MGLAGSDSKKVQLFKTGKYHCGEFLIELCKGTSENDVVQWLLAKNSNRYDGSKVRSLLPATPASNFEKQRRVDVDVGDRFQVSRKLESRS